MKLFYGSSNPQLAKKLAQSLDVPCGKILLGKYPNDEIKIRINDTNGDALLLQSLSRPVHTHLIEFCLIADALKRIGTNKLIGIIPWLGYSKQDKVFLMGEPQSVKVIAKIIQTSQVNPLICVDLHNPAITGFFDIPVQTISALPLFVAYQQKHHQQLDWIVISPDAGAVKSSTEFAQCLRLDVAYLNKKRNLLTGKVTVVDIDRPIKGFNCLILDDMISTGSTLLETTKFLKSKGANKIRIYATHHLFVPGVQQKLDRSPIDQLIITDTIQKPIPLPSKKLKTLSVAPLIASTVKSLF